MASWMSFPEEKGVSFTNELASTIASFVLGASEEKPSYGFHASALASGGKAIQNMDVPDRALPGGIAVKEKVYSCSTPDNMSSEDEKSCFKLFRPFTGTVMQESAMMDLKLGRLVEARQISKANESGVVPSKRSRFVGSCAQTSFCQVQGCNMDLSSSRHYHKRHRVCDAHSKTPKVVVNGIEQRFCQQCSRFQLLAEFDDRKRSCRRRLAGHNERRRKPAFHSLPDNQVTEEVAFVWSEAHAQSKSSVVGLGYEEFFSIHHPGIGVVAPNPSVEPNSSRVLSLLSAESRAAACHKAGINLNCMHVSGHVHSAQAVSIKTRQGNNPRDTEDRKLAPKRGSTVNLLELVSNLERVEHQRNSLPLDNYYSPTFRF